MDRERLFGKKKSIPNHSQREGNKKVKKQSVVASQAKGRNYPIVKQCQKEYVDKLTRRRYSESTIKTYTSLFTDFINYYADREPKNITEDDIKQYQLYLVKERGVSQSTQNQAINAIKFYYEHVLGLEKKKYWIDRPLKEKKLPVVLSKEEVKDILK